VTDRPTAATITAEQLAQLYADLDRYEEVLATLNETLVARSKQTARAEADLAALRQVARGYCPACGRGDAAPTVADWEQQKTRADRAEATLDRVRALRDKWLLMTLEPGQVRRLLDQLTHTIGGKQTATEATGPATWLLAGTRDLAIPGQHQLTVRPVDPEEERAASDRDACEHHYETRILGGHPITVTACTFCRTPDWPDLYEQAENLYRWGREEALAGKPPRERLSAYDMPRQGEPPAHDAGPDIADCRADDRRWPLEKAGE
jgi:hypothetical protein